MELEENRGQPRQEEVKTGVLRQAFGILTKQEIQQLTNIAAAERLDKIESFLGDVTRKLEDHRAYKTQRQQDFEKLRQEVTVHQNSQASENQQEEARIIMKEVDETEIQIQLLEAEAKEMQQQKD